MSVHTIRLRGPWQASLDSKTGDTFALQVPGPLPNDLRSQLRASDFETLVISRSFGCPTSLDGDQRIFLSIHSAARTAKVCLNEQPLGTVVPEKPLRIACTEILRPRNRVDLRFSFFDKKEIDEIDLLLDPWVGLVQLEIE